MHKNLDALVNNEDEDKNKSNREMAKLVGVSEKCVRTTRKNYDTFGTPKESTRPGRPRKLTYRDENSIFIHVRKNPTISNRKLASDFKTKFKDVKVNRETVRRFLTRKGIGTYTALKKPMLTASDRI